MYSRGILSCSGVNTMQGQWSFKRHITVGRGGGWWMGGYYLIHSQRPCGHITDIYESDGYQEKADRQHRFFTCDMMPPPTPRIQHEHCTPHLTSRIAVINGGRGS